MKAPSYYEELARQAEAAELWTKAANLWSHARGASLGTTRRQRYENNQTRCLENAIIEENRNASI